MHLQFGQLPIIIKPERNRKINKSTFYECRQKGKNKKNKQLAKTETDGLLKGLCMTKCDLCLS